MWAIITSVNAGIGLVYLLRWYWWRINAWSEITAISASVFISAPFVIYKWFPNPRIILRLTPYWLWKIFRTTEFPVTLLYIIPFSVTCWVIVTLLTKPTREKKLIEFYKHVRPGGPGWRRIKAKIPGAEKDRIGLSNLKGYIAAVIGIYAALIGTGKLILGSTWLGLVLMLVTVFMGYLIYKVFTSDEEVRAPLG